MSHHTIIDVSDLPQPFVTAIEAAIRTFREQTGSAPIPARIIGWASDILPELPESFFQPLPNDVLDLFDGKHS